MIKTKYYILIITCLWLQAGPFQLVPTTVAAVRASYGAAAAFDIMPAVWVSSAVSLAVGIAAAAVLKRLWD